MKVPFMFLLCFTVFFHALFTCVTAVDNLSVNQTIKDGQTIVSPQQTFELGFFSPGNNSHNRYLGIWFKKLATGTIFWIANRETPITNKTGELTLGPDGVLVLSDSATHKTIWSSISWRGIRNSPLAPLLDDGNFMVIDGKDGRDTFVWQSFDYPTDTQVSGMPCGRSMERGTYSNITSWISADDPSKGRYMIYMVYNGLPQVYQNDGDTIEYRLGSWNGVAYIGGTSYQQNPTYVSIYVSNEREIYSGFNSVTNSVITRLTLSHDGNMQQFNWNNPTEGWVLYSSLTTDSCERYKLCGDNGICDFSKSPNCGCLKGFSPKRPDQWSFADWSSGCQRDIPLNCSGGEGFSKFSFVKIPDTQRSWFDENMTIEECKAKCRHECNCTAYVTLNIKYSTGCLLWYGELIDMRILPNNGQDIYIRMSAKELEKDKGVSGNKIQVRIIISIVIIVGLIILIGLLILYRVRLVLVLISIAKPKPTSQDVLDLPFFSFSSLIVATNNFSVSNKLGEGGFGPVYKGSLEIGQEIAVKRLSTSSTQGVEEFKNEVMFLSKLQHRNLVKILGSCVEREEKMLVYEFMTNKGLDLFLFEPSLSNRLDWSQRFQIINGIARGLLYLHQDSPVRIIHRDLKASNILLDQDMNPKISDFGLARSFLGTEIETINTKRVVGTFGYMSPEYAGDGIFSVKSDVFSFGVLMLEIVSGKKNRSSLLGNAWRLFIKGMALELADDLLIKSTYEFEVLRSIHVGLLCAQHNPNDRPNMSTVVMMLCNNSRLPEPKQPGFYMEESKLEHGTKSSSKTLNSNCSSKSTTFLESR